VITTRSRQRWVGNGATRLSSSVHDLSRLLTAVAAFQTAQGLNANGVLDREVWDKLTASSNGPALIEYTLADIDVKGPFLKKLPTKLDRLQDLGHLGYTSAREGLAEKFHMSQTLLKELNPGKSFDKIGETIVVANVKDGSPLARASKVEVDKPHRILRAFANDGQMLAVFPASIGSAEKPAPSGRYNVTSVSRNPTYRYNPEYRFKGQRRNGPVKYSAGSDCG
jgi:lipoprotein-anchoring transpeptidase ErfK/SrfK